MWSTVGHKGSTCDTKLVQKGIVVDGSRMPYGVVRTLMGGFVDTHSGAVEEEGGDIWTGGVSGTGGGEPVQSVGG